MKYTGIHEGKHDDRKFYEAHGFAASGRKQSALGAIEEMYIKEI